MMVYGKGFTGGIGLTRCGTSWQREAGSQSRDQSVHPRSQACPASETGPWRGAQEGAQGNSALWVLSKHHWWPWSLWVIRQKW